MIEFATKLDLAAQELIRKFVMQNPFLPGNTCIRIRRILGTINPQIDVNPAQFLHPIEMSYIQRANQKRVLEFIAGRVCAKQALAELGHRVELIERDEHRAPIWPAGVVGSITHSGRLSGAIVASRDDYRGVGLDIEKNKALKPGTINYICNQDELEANGQLGKAVPEILYFSAKEAVYKCAIQAAGVQLSFRDASIQFFNKEQFRVILHRHPEIDARALAGRYRIGTGYVYTVVTMV